MSSVNNNVKVDRLQVDLQSQQAQDAQLKKQREELFQGSDFVAGAQVSAPTGYVAQPNPFAESIGADRRSAIQSRISGMSPADKANFDVAVAKFLEVAKDPASSETQITQSAAAVSDAMGNDAAPSTVSGGLNAQDIGGDNPEEIIEGAFAAIEANDQELGQFAVDVQSLNDLKRQIGADSSEIRTTIQELNDIKNDPDTTYPFEYSYETYGYDDEGNRIVTEHTVTIDSPEGIDNLTEGLNTELANLDDLRASVGDDAQLEMLKLQQALQTGQQLFQMLTNITDQMHKTSKETLNNWKV